MKTIEEIKLAFQPVPKLDNGQTHKVLKIGSALQLAAEEILDLVPDCADRTHAMRLVLDAKFWCVQAITHLQATPKKVDDKTKAQQDEGLRGLTPAPKDH